MLRSELFNNGDAWHKKSTPLQGKLLRQVFVLITPRAPGGTSALGGSLFPAFEGQTVVDALHRDAVLNRANQRAEIAAHTMVLIDSRDTSSGVTALLRPRLARIQLRNGCSRDTLCRFGFNHRRSSRRIWHRRCPIQMNALMRTVPTGGVAELASDA